MIATELRSLQGKKNDRLAIMQAKDAAGDAAGSAKNAAGDVKVRNFVICTCALSDPHARAVARCVQSQNFEETMHNDKGVLNKHPIHWILSPAQFCFAGLCQERQR